MTSKKIIELGYSDFKEFINSGNYFVDKSMLIYDLLTKGAYISLMPRPKRFGKTLNLSMIEHFFDIQKKDSAKLFADFEIAKETEFCKKHQNKYPVINISLKNIKETNWTNCLDGFKQIVIKLYEKFDFLLQSDKLKESEKKRFKDIIKENSSEKKYKTSLQDLSEYLQKHFKKKVIILVDEYDAPIITAFNNTNSPIKTSDKENKTYYQKVISFMQGFLGDAYKGNDTNLKKGLLTGVMRVGRESIFLEWNNFSVYGITSHKFDTYFGFTEKETKNILTYFDLQNKIYDVKKWYDGYKFGTTSQIYNPWSIVNYIDRNNEGFKAYWVNTSDPSLIKNRLTEEGVKEKIQDLIEGKMIEKELMDDFVFADFETDRELIWTLLTYNGYLTQVEKGKYGNYKLKIPNNEIKIVFTNIIMTWLKSEVKIKRDLLISMSENLINSRITEFEKDFRKIVRGTISYYDTAEKKDKNTDEVFISHEQIYHVYTLGLLAILSDDYKISSNKESGEGRYDIMLIPYDKSQNGIIIEIKKIEKRQNNEKNISKFKERINKKLDEALRQIEINEYYTELLDSKIKLDNIIKLGIVFAGKIPYVKRGYPFKVGQ